MAKILIVEDDPLVSRMYQKVIRFEGMDVIAAENGSEGVEMARAQKPDLILLDVMMPKMNGLEVLEVIKADKDIGNIPVVMLTNLSGTQDAENAMKRGAYDYLVKSQFKPKEVADKVKEILTAKGTTPAAAPAQVSEAQTPVEAASEEKKDTVS